MIKQYDYYTILQIILKDLFGIDGYAIFKYFFRKSSQAEQIVEIQMYLIDIIEYEKCII